MQILDKISFLFSVSMILIYLVIAPILLINEYKTNEKFKDFIFCEEKQYSIESCSLTKSMQMVIDRSNLIITFIIVFWSGLIVEKDILPNIDKIKAWFDNLEK